SIRTDRTNVIVEVSVPSGFQRVTLESRPRFDQGTWAPLAVGQNDGSSKTMNLRGACSPPTEMIPVRADAPPAFAGNFFYRTNTFSGPMDSSAVASGGPGVVTITGDGPSSNGDSARAVVESDIWQIDGDRLYFFNQYRGLQVIDITSPDTATVLGTLELPAAG